MARSRAKFDNTTTDWTTIHQGTVGTSVAMDMFGNAFFYLEG